MTREERLKLLKRIEKDIHVCSLESTFLDTAPIIMSDESWFDGQNTWHNDNRINHKRGYLSDVIAWMPLPTPYEPQERSGEE